MYRSGAAMPPPYRSADEPLKAAQPKSTAPVAAQPSRAPATGAQGPGVFQSSSHFEKVDLSPEAYGYRNYGTFPNR